MKARFTVSRALSLSVLALGLTTLGADCEGNIVQDPTFRDWCGSGLCSWQTDFGQIKRVPTWDAEDFGVAFLDNGEQGTQISQATDESQAKCVLFTSVGDIDPAAEMKVSVDFNNDGTVDFIAPLGAATWHKVQAEITAPPSYGGITFHVTKAGTGTAVLAEMAVTSTTGCTAAPPPMKTLRLGETCASTSECAAGLVCPDEGAHVCSECSAQNPCADAAVACWRRSLFFPLQCAPGESLGLSGAPCVANDDCVSGVCAGASPVGAAGQDAAACDLSAITVADAGSCSWDTVLGGNCR